MTVAFGYPKDDVYVAANSAHSETLSPGGSIMSEITAWVRDYVRGDMTYDELRARLADVEFLDPWRSHPEMPTNVDERNAFIDSHVPEHDGTVLELRDAVTREGLPWEVYRRLLSDLASR